MQERLRHLDTNVKHPDIVEAELAVISTEHIELAFYNICRVAAARTRAVVASLHLFPVVGVDIEHMHVVHPVNPIVATKVIDLGVNEAPSCRDSRTWLGSTHLRLNPRKRRRIEVKNVI